MLATFMIAICVLVIALYVQTRLAAREIRRHRAISPVQPAKFLVLKNRV